MEIRKVLALRGPNIWSHFPVLEAWVDLGSLKDSASDEMPGFNERLTSWLPSMIEHRCSVGTRGGFFERLRRGTYLAHILEHVTLELQTLAGTDVGYGRARETSEEGVYKVAIEFEFEALGRACLAVGRELCLAAVYDRPFDVEAEVAKLRELLARVRPQPATAAVMKAARACNVPVLPLGKPDFIQLGHGKRQRRVLAGQTDRTSALAESISRDEELTRSLLKSVGVPTAEAGDTNGTPTWKLLVVGKRVVAAARLDPAAPAQGEVHPEVEARAVDAAQVVGLDVAGITLAAHDLQRPLEEQSGSVISVEAQPDWTLFGDPQGDTLSRVGEAIVGELFGPGETGRIPIVNVTGVNGKTTTTRLIAHIAAQTHRCVGMTCTDGIFVDGRLIEAGDCSGPLSAKAVLQNPLVEVAVLETARGGILRAGLGFDRCDVAVVTNIGEGDHLGLAGIDTIEQLAKVKRTPVEAVAPTGTAVLKADDPHVLAMASACPGSVVLFARNSEDPAIVAHRAKGGRAVFVRDRRVVLAEGSQEIPLVALDRVPITHGGRVGFQVENVLAAAGAAWSLGTPCEVIHAALESFVADLHKTPARFNIIEINRATVIMDYGHNVSSLACVIETLEQLPNQRRSVVYSAAGDRRDEDLIRQAELLGDAFDRVIIYEDENCNRGRKDGEIIALFREGLAGRSRVKKIEEVRGAVKAVEVALTSARPGELLLVQVDVVDETVQLVDQYLATMTAREINLREALEVSHPEKVPATGRTSRR